jgi:hypothetical protein
MRERIARGLTRVNAPAARPAIMVAGRHESA